MPVSVKVTRYEVRQAERDYGDHMRKHKCSLGDGCETRLALWADIMEKASLWNEPS